MRKLWTISLTAAPCGDSVKARQHDTLDIPGFLHTIDAMPMRQNEMRSSQ